MMRVRAFLLEASDDLDILKQHGQLNDSYLMIQWYVMLSLHIYLFTFLFNRISDIHLTMEKIRNSIKENIYINCKSLFTF